MTAQQRADLRDPSIPKTAVWVVSLQPDGGDINLNTSNIDVTFNSTTYSAALDKFTLEGQLSTGAALVPETVTLQFDANDQHTSGTPLYNLLRSDWHLRRIYIACLFFNHTTGDFIICPREFYGTMERLTVQEQPAGQAMALLECETGTFRALDSNRITCSDRDQRIRSATDTFFLNTSVTGTRQVPFGISSNAIPGWGNSGGTSGGGGGGGSTNIFTR